MRRRVIRKWRPPLALVLFGALIGAVVVAFLCLALIRNISSPHGVLLSAVGCFFLLCYLAWLLARLILRPVLALSERARAAEAGESIALTPLRHYGTPELSEMGEAVLAMAERLHTRAEDLQAYADHVTHELKSPLTSLAAASEMLKDPALSEDERFRLADTSMTATARMSALLEALQKLAQASAPKEGETGDAADRAHSAAKDAALSLDAPETLVLPLSPETVDAIFVHLMSNAAAHGAISISLRRDADRLLICDDGAGISAGNRDRIFDPFFTTRRDSGGTGMGLSILKQMIAAEGGDIRLVESDGGACFEVLLPR